jgi:hypothetical protein
VKATLINPNSRNGVQMLDAQVMNNNFYCIFARNCAESYPTKTVALELRGGARIYTSDAGSIGQIELAITWL